MNNKVKFHRNTNPFQQLLQRDIKKIKTSDKVFIPSDKTKNYYEVDRALHTKLLTYSITQTYQIASDAAPDTEPNPCAPTLETTTDGGSRAATDDTHSNATAGATTDTPNVTPVLLLNARGLVKLTSSKIPYLRDLATCSQAICVALTETHLTSNIADAEIHIPKYAVFRTDRRDRTHGGVAMYIREDVTPLVLLSHSNAVCDTLIVHMKQLEMVICTTYRPPDAPHHEDKFEDSLNL